MASRVSAVEVTSLKSFFSEALRELPRPGLARIASLCFSLAVLTTPFAFYVPLKLFAAAFYLFVDIQLCGARRDWSCA